MSKSCFSVLSFFWSLRCFVCNEQKRSESITYDVVKQRAIWHIFIHQYFCSFGPCYTAKKLTILSRLKSVLCTNGQLHLWEHFDWLTSFFAKSHQTNQVPVLYFWKQPQFCFTKALNINKLTSYFAFNTLLKFFYLTEEEFVLDNYHFWILQHSGMKQHELSWLLVCPLLQMSLCTHSQRPLNQPNILDWNS